MRRLMVAGAVALAAALPARAESDWARQTFRNIDEARAATGSRAAVPAPSSISLFNPGDAAKAIGKADPSKDPAKNQKDPTKKELLFVKPDLPPGKGPWQWKIRKASWSSEDERGYEEFLRTIGESDCKTVHECITSAAANPRHHATSPPYMQFFADCADLPYFLRGYFSWKNGLPFSFSIKYGHQARAIGDRSSVAGRQITDRFDIVGPGPDARRAMPAIGQYVSSEHFRVPPAYVGRLLPDFYPVRLTRDSIRPGTVIFDPDGHVAVVFKVTDNGLIHYIDAHPDNSLTRGIYARDFARAAPQMGAGFKRWRPQVLKGAARAGDGTLVGGHIELKPDRELADWSDEQFYGNAGPRPRLWSDGKFQIDGVEADYYDYLRLRLAYPGFKYDPIGEVKTKIRSLCDDLHERVAAVNLAIKAGYHRRPQPPRLPQNIYATSGEWEIYSTPSRDARLKTSFEELRDEVARFIEMARANSKLLTYEGDDLQADLRQIYRQEAAACTISYVKTDDSIQPLGFSELTRRLFRLSFDPYHCIERRWGATDPAELKSCPDGSDKLAWYEAEDRLRNQVTRTYGEPMGWTLAQLQNRKLDIGIVEEPDVDVEKVLDATATIAAAAAVKSAAPPPARLRRAAAIARPNRARLVAPVRHRP